jgi:RNA recognition motif-containing protein
VEPKQLGLRGGGDEEAAAAEERVVVAVPPNPCKLFIGNLAPKTEEGELKAFIDSVGAGVLSELVIKRDKRGVCKGYAMATFASPAGLYSLRPHILIA